MGFLRYLLRRLVGPRRNARVVRRVEMRCPHTAEAVEIELLMGPTGRPCMVLRCSRRPEAPPECDSARMMAEVAEVRDYPRLAAAFLTNSKAMYWQTPSGLNSWR